MADAEKSQDQAPTEDVLGNLPATRPGRRSSRRADGAGTAQEKAPAKAAAGTKAKAPAKATAGTKAKAPASAKAKAPSKATAGAEAAPTSRAGGGAAAPKSGASPGRPARGTRRVPAASSPAPEQPPVSAAPRSGWATPDRDEAPSTPGIGVGSLVKGAAKQGEKLVGGVAKRPEKVVRGVLKRLGRG